MVVPGRMCDKIMYMCLSSSVGNTEDQHFLLPLLHNPENTHGPSNTLPLFYLPLSPNLDSSISMVFLKPPSLISAFRILLEQIDLTTHLVGFERLVSHEILLPEICIAHRNIRCSQVLNGMLDPSICTVCGQAGHT